MTTQEIADSLFTTYVWDFKDLTYSFYSDAVPYEDEIEPENTLEASDALKSASHKFFDYVETILDMTFTYTEEVGDIVIASKDISNGALGYAYTPESGTEKNTGGDLFMNSIYTVEDYKIGGTGWSTLVHELGHALGLQHPFDEGPYEGIDINDTVMSYNRFYGYDEFNEYNYDTYNFSTYQSADILALQELYGKNETVLDDVYDLNELLFSQQIEDSFATVKDSLYTIYDPYGLNGIDMRNISSFNQQFLDISSQKESVIINGDVHHYLSFTDDTVIYNVAASKGNDTIVLNEQNNMVYGNIGTDSVYITSNSSSRIDKLDDEQIIISNASSGFDKLLSVEKLYINDTLINTDDFLRSSISVTDYESSVTISRLYLSAFDRLADSDGLNSWTNEYIQNNDLSSIANAFINSNEFGFLYTSNQSDEEFIEQIYENILSREAQADGAQYWLNLLQNNTLSKEDVLISIASSEEAINLTGIYFENEMISIL